MADGGTETVGPEGEQRARKHVFAVNSSRDILNLVRDLLQEEHYTVTTMTYGPRTFEQIAASQPDLLLIDVAVGEQAGWDLLDHLEESASTRGIPIVVFSTDPCLLDQARVQTRGDADRRFVAKPFDIDELAATVREMIGRA